MNRIVVCSVDSACQGLKGLRLTFNTEKAEKSIPVLFYPYNGTVIRNRVISSLFVATSSSQLGQTCCFSANQDRAKHNRALTPSVFPRLASVTCFTPNSRCVLCLAPVSNFPAFDTRCVFTALHPDWLVTLLSFVPSLFVVVVL